MKQKQKSFEALKECVRQKNAIRRREPVRRRPCLYLPLPSMRTIQNVNPPSRIRLNPTAQTVDCANKFITLTSVMIVKDKSTVERDPVMKAAVTIEFVQAH
ncbi:unnamed protein product [Dovyalis caffra]|uniref:Uncharacterized protein n=1 Tax=Dovyalis caffra TaxID=77055 RepID=A0AAV1SE49_9ROSI|nr:unnamed protein product [Dovyalis caffra]